ncbi:XRE family transcriptional regulator [Sphingomonas sp. IC4-52]|uniref:XRE family transcriptional regulator n=1 Tax=Sphingomonas sp. IC4-52 TaxID=2887202 RepID=UPI001D11C1CD|nr:XRE family transcriptional regulator [Sphingomonas sp. IC4-52]MCC2978883.1 XRE family transcriptional regulator [Sphingomonas sp. IC4-52]
MAQLLDLHQVAAKIRTQPHVPEHDLVAWLEGIEADVVPASITTIDVLHAAFRFDRSVLAALDAIVKGERDPEHTPRICRICACSWRLPCTRSGEACAWISGEDLCSGCVDALAAPVAEGAAA